MKTIRRIFLALLILVVLAAVVGVVFVYRVGHRALPDYNENLQLSGLSAEVEVFRDAHGIPHIYAQNETDLYRAVGYVMAQDRLWQMDLLRRATQGRLSEIFGADLAQTDYLMRALRIPEKSDLVLSRLDTATTQSLAAFADGVNQYIARQGSKLPPEFTILGYQPEAWQLKHSVNLIGYMAWDLTMAWSSEVLLHKLSQKLDTAQMREIVPDMAGQKGEIFQNFGFTDSSELAMREKLLSATKPLVRLGIGAFSGSNNWAVAGKKSTTGKPLLANDMHLGLFAPGIWYQMHQVVEGKLDVSGVVLPGQPLVICGHNAHIAWGMTNVMLDDMDFYAETLHPDDSTRYRLDGEWKQMEVRPVEIRTKQGDTIRRTLRFTHRGPIVSEIKNTRQAVSMRWIGNSYSNELRTVYLLNRAQNWEDFRHAAKTFIAISQNIVYADVQGNIGLHTCAGVPVREGDGKSIYPGDTSRYDWQGLVAFDSLPHVYNPESGFVASANNKTVGNHYPYHISHWFDLPYRMNRIREMLTAKEKLSVNDFKAMHADFKSKLVEEMLPKLTQTLGAAELSPTGGKALEQLQNWDGVLTKESPAPSIFENFYLLFVENLVKDEMGDELFADFFGNKILIRNLVHHVWHNPQAVLIDNVQTQERETFEQIVTQSFTQAVARLNNDYGSDPAQWNWGKMHTLTLEHPMGSVAMLDKLFGLNSKTYPVGGSFHTVCPYAYSHKKLFESNHGASHRHIYTVGVWDSSQTIIPTGTSGIPASDFYCDQTEMYINHQYHADYVSRRKIEDNARFKMKFSDSQ